jgi:apolipoprotein N-acyltransferase
VLVPVSTAAYGHFRLKTIQELLTAPETPRLTVGWIQPNFTIHGRKRNAWEDGRAAVIAMTRNLAGSQPAPDLIIWPEIPPPVSYTENADDRALIDRLVAETKTPMLVAGYTNGSMGKDHYYNAIEFIRKPGNAEIYLKQRLLPFGEYLPGEKHFPFIRKVFPGALNYIPGSDSKILHMNEDVKLIPLICYEAIFPKMVAEGRKLGGNLIINPVNDAWFGNSAGPEIHLALALFRAAEFRTPVVRATNSGIGAVVTATGGLDSASVTPLFEQCTVTATVAIPQITTLYSRTGDLFLWACAFGSLICLGIDIRKKIASTVMK